MYMGRQMMTKLSNKSQDNSRGKQSKRIASIALLTKFTVLSLMQIWVEIICLVLSSGLWAESQELATKGHSCFPIPASHLSPAQSLALDSIKTNKWTPRLPSNLQVQHSLHHSSYSMYCGQGTCLTYGWSRFDFWYPRWSPKPTSSNICEPLPKTKQNEKLKHFPVYFKNASKIYTEP